MNGQFFAPHACNIHTSGIGCFPVTKRGLFADHLTITHPMTSCVTFVNIYLTINQNLCMQKHQNTRWVYACVFTFTITQSVCIDYMQYAARIFFCTRHKHKGMLYCAPLVL